LSDKYEIKIEAVSCPEGAAEGTRVAHLENPCSFNDGHNNWQGGLISFGEKLLRDFPASAGNRTSI